MGLAGIGSATTGGLYTKYGVGLVMRAEVVYGPEYSGHHRYIVRDLYVQKSQLHTDSIGKLIFQAFVHRSVI